MGGQRERVKLPLPQMPYECAEHLGLLGGESTHSHDIIGVRARNWIGPGDWAWKWG